MDTRTKEQIKADRNERARLRMAEYYKTQAYRDWYASSRDQRNARKERYRRAKGAEPIEQKKERARLAKEIEKAKKEFKELKKKEIDGWADAHVKRFYEVQKNRAKYYAVKEKDPEKEARKKRIDRVELRDPYIKKQLLQMGIARELLTPEIIELKREQLALRRLSREAEQAAVKQMENEHETI
jgi:Fe2+ transport system protein FeoA